MNTTREMFKLGQAVFTEGIKKLNEYKQMNFIHDRHKMIIKKRLAVTEMVHGIELILKALLIKKGYSIYKVRSGIFKDKSRLQDIIDIDKTVDLVEVIKFFKTEYPYLSFDGIDKLRQLRNQIMHRGTNIDEKKKEYFMGAIDCLTALYESEQVRNRTFLAELVKARETI